jgi:predicted enzyme related to lactoylglutathione lyase
VITRIGLVAMYVRDQEEARRFYTERAGFDTTVDATVGEIRVLAVAPPGAQTALGLLPLGTHGPELAARFEAEIGFSPHLLFVCDDLDETIAELRRRGAEVSGPDTDLGLRGGRLMDLNGNVITLVDGEVARLMTGL